MSLKEEGLANVKLLQKVAQESYAATNTHLVMVFFS